VPVLDSLRIRANCPASFRIDLALFGSSSEPWPKTTTCCQWVSIRVPAGTVDVFLDRKELRSAGLSGFLGGTGMSADRGETVAAVVDPASGQLVPANQAG